MTHGLSPLTVSMLERTRAMKRMELHHLDYSWAPMFSLTQLEDCCDRMDQNLKDSQPLVGNMQKELIQNPSFASYYGVLQKMRPQGGGTGETHNEHTHVDSNRKEITSHTKLQMAVSDLLEECWGNGKAITDYPQESVLDTLERSVLKKEHWITYLDNIAPLELSEKDRSMAASNIKYCVEVPRELSRWQKRLLLEPYVYSRHLFAAERFSEVSELLENNPNLVDIARLLHDGDIEEYLGLEQYRSFIPDAEERCQLMKDVLRQLDKCAAGFFMECWGKGGYTLFELQAMKRRMEQHPGLDWEAVFSNYPGYVNLLYGVRYKTLDPSLVDSHLEDILTYAITANKKHFIRLVDANEQLLRSCSKGSLLVADAFYKRHFNLNELTERDLVECMRMEAKKMPILTMMVERRYTFPEIAALYDTSEIYVHLYNHLVSESQDYRLRVLRQLVKRNALKDFTKEDAEALAEQLNIKPIHDWQQVELGHIEGLTTADAAQLMANYVLLRPLIPDMRRRTDALLALRNLEKSAKVRSIIELKESVLQDNPDWTRLMNRMDLSEAFIEKHRESICEFLCSNGAHVANTYLCGLGHREQDAFLRVVKAELMGQLGALKYFEGDLQEELNIPISEQVLARWKENTGAVKGGLSIQEHDDFFATMFLGVQPQRTCMSYIDGAYRECLLSGFDSNKKILYASRGGQIVGRAYLRLTKGRLSAGSENDMRDTEKFTFVDLEDITGSRKKQDGRERLVLFLERPYISGASPELAHQIKREFIRHTEQKAELLGSMLVLSDDYLSVAPESYAHTRLFIYISKSKAGAQYLDSLGGQASVSNEGCYKPNTFMVKDPHRLPC